MQLLATISGTVIRHLGRGASIGFPTANISYDGNLTDGVYTATVVHLSQEYQAVGFIGKPLSFPGEQRRLEVHIFDFDQNIYDQQITVYLHTFLRENHKYASVSSLCTQIEKDIAQTRDFFATMTI